MVDPSSILAQTVTMHYTRVPMIDFVVMFRTGRGACWTRNMRPEYVGSGSEKCNTRRRPVGFVRLFVRNNLAPQGVSADAVITGERSSASCPAGLTNPPLNHPLKGSATRNPTRQQINMPTKAMQEH